MEITISHKKDVRKAILIALLLHLAAFILFLCIGLVQPDPLPTIYEVPIVMADFGNSDVGSGNTEAERTLPLTRLKKSPSLR